MLGRLIDFLEHLQNNPSIPSCCRAARLAKSTLDDLREQDLAFDRLVIDCQIMGQGKIEEDLLFHATGSRRWMRPLRFAWVHTKHPDVVISDDDYQKLPAKGGSRSKATFRKVAVTERVFNLAAFNRWVDMQEDIPAWADARVKVAAAADKAKLPPGGEGAGKVIEVPTKSENVDDWQKSAAATPVASEGTADGGDRSGV
ncbi:MAG: hypothetical protein OXC14_17235 [Rhodospirillaceae bacterium]|nr:hypothetical protein [Rhodospirillaceae bacterium]